jgi:hypothetical protein
MTSLVPDGNVAPDGTVHVVDTGAAPPVTAGGAYETVNGTVATLSATSAGQAIVGRLTGGGWSTVVGPPPQPATSASRGIQASVKRGRDLVLTAGSAG